jgi:serine/threonine protein kinase
LKQNSSEEEILIILFQILQGLKHLHDNNIVHRNIKPENILVMKNRQIKIADFGFAKIIESTMISHLTFAGTPQYIAPEFYLNQLRDKPSDIWSVGIITYHLATQHLPFIGKTSMEIRNLIIHSDPDPIRNHFSNAFKDMVSSMLIKSPKFRPSVDQILSVLKEHFSSIPFPQIESPSQFDLNPPVDFNRFPTTIPGQQQAQVNILNVLHQIPETVTGQ